MAYTTIDDPTIYFNTVLYTGNGSTQSVTGFGHAPNLIWTKERNNAKDHAWYDSVRGANQLLESNKNGADSTTSAGISSFDSDGFTTGDFFQTNDNGDSYVSWGWKAGTSFSNDASATSVGTIDSTGSINTTAGFSIISYTGTGSNGTIAHGLGAVPRWIIVKVRDASNNWVVQHGSLGATKRLLLDGTQAEASASTFFNNTDPTSSVFSVGTEDITNNSGNAYIAYLFAEKKGYSKFGSYTGNGNADGSFVYTGFKPAMVIIKNTGQSRNWSIYDNKRNSFNVVNSLLAPNDSVAEDTGNPLDFLSNGFKLKDGSTTFNGSGDSHIFMAFAESPLVNSNGVPNNAR